MKLTLICPGNWTRPILMFRMLEVIESPWTITDVGFTNPETGDRADIAFGGPATQLAGAFANMDDPVRPPFADELLEELQEHKLLVYLEVEVDPEHPLQSCLGLLRAANAVVDSGALAVFFANSQLAHEADAFQALMTDVEAATDDGALLDALFRVCVRFHVGAGGCFTLGGRLLGRPDAVIANPGSADRAVGQLERLVLGDDAKNADDDRGYPDILENPYGLILRAQ